jgi:hypothetical protein
MVFVKTFKGYEDKTLQLDELVNGWILKTNANVMSIQTVLSHEYEGRAKSGDLLYTVIYKADQPFAE